MSEYRSTLELVENEEPRRDQSSFNVAESEAGYQEAVHSGRRGRQKLPSIVEGDFSPLGLTSIQRNFRSKIREARIKANDGCPFSLALLEVISESVLWIGCLAIGIALPIIMIIIGIVNLDKCPKLPSLAILVILEGGLILLEDTINAIDYFVTWKPGFIVRLNRDQRALIIGVINGVINVLATLIIFTLAAIIHLSSSPNFTLPNTTSPAPAPAPATLSTFNKTTTALNNITSPSLLTSSSQSSSQTSSQSISIPLEYCQPVFYKFICWLVNVFLFYTGLIVLLMAIGSLIQYMRMAKK
ncbi:uncharacterized protein LOC141854471 [Brevipalpus obovatus]|uniref:uncharacterized protein LOC141854471 n=1 Tax=Brevipalpus obovatus TaxID=246614 RepID=UPI003D9E63FA